MLDEATQDALAEIRSAGLAAMEYGQVDLAQELLSELRWHARWMEDLVTATEPEVST